MDFVYSPRYEVDLGPHVFPTVKYRLIYEQLRAEGIVTAQNLVEPHLPERAELAKILLPGYLEDLLAARSTIRTRPSELPVEPEIIQAQLLAGGGSVQAAMLALEHGAAYHIGGGFHHAFTDHAEGFCYLNDIVLAVNRLLEKGIPRIAVIDCDLHQGNGTARYFEPEERVFTFSIHQERLFPPKQRSDLDVGLDNETGDEAYLDKLNHALDSIFGDFGPSFVIFQCGADPYRFDQLGQLRLTVEGLSRRDEAVTSRCAGRKIPMIAVLGGGYAEDLSDTVEIHCQTARTMVRYYR
jgi:acetoin utilization deacetylase AcuC-like enzyme